MSKQRSTYDYRTFISKNRNKRSTYDYDVKWFRKELNTILGTIQILERAAYKGEVTVMVPLHNAESIYDWCLACLGEGGRNHKYKWRRSHLKPWQFFFRDQAALTMFRLRWSNTTE
jgi:hypothetical protein